MATERLQKIIANAGIASRRKAEQLITGGAVTVNGQVVTELGTKADSDVDFVKVNGKLIRGAQKKFWSRACRSDGGSSRQVRRTRQDASTAMAPKPMMDSMKSRPNSRSQAK